MLPALPKASTNSQPLRPNPSAQAQARSFQPHLRAQPLSDTTHICMHAHANVFGRCGLGAWGARTIEPRYHPGPYPTLNLHTTHKNLVCHCRRGFGTGTQFRPAGHTVTDRHINRRRCCLLVLAIVQPALVDCIFFAVVNSSPVGVSFVAIEF
jgi:hypothetical protein